MPLNILNLTQNKMKKEYRNKIKNLFKGNDVYRIFGPAGTGKTTYLINELKALFKKGVEPNRIAFVSFTNRAVTELVERCSAEFTNINKEDFIYFRTIHSLCFKFLSGKKVIKQSEISKLAKSQGLEVSYYKNIEDGSGTKKGDKVLTIESLARLKLISLEQQWKESNFVDLPFHVISNWCEIYKDHKMQNNLIDFTDMLEFYEHELDVDYIFIDECQDLSPLQWEVMDIAARKTDTVYIAGDDDQSIYSWAGAEIDYILNIKAQKDIVLPKSYRLPEAIYNKSSGILNRIKNRKSKKYTHNGKKGQIDTVFDFKTISYKDESDCLLLVRNRWQLKEVKTHLEHEGIPYYLFGQSSLESSEIEALIYWEHIRKGRELPPRQFKKMSKHSKILNKLISVSQIPTEFYEMAWYDILDLIPLEIKNYIRRILANGYNLFDKPKIKLSTIHQSKGGEADTVVLFTDVSNMVWENIWNDNEHRVWYVAVTRAKNKLIIIQEQSNKFYKI